MHKKKVGVPIVITYEVTKDLSISHESSVQRKLEDDLCLIRAEITFVHNVCSIRLPDAIGGHVDRVGFDDKGYLLHYEFRTLMHQCKRSNRKEVKIHKEKRYK